jgi:hypothetical protein
LLNFKELAMLIYAVVKDNMVVNTVIATPDYAASQGWVEAVADVDIGLDYINGQFVDNRPKPVIEAAPAAPTKEELLAQLQALQTQIQALS